MSSAPQSESSPPPNPVLGAQSLSRIAFGIAFLCYAGMLIGLAVPLPAILHGWMEAAFIVFLSITTIANLARQLPVSKVLVGAVIIALVSGGITTIGTRTSIPFGPFYFTAAAGPVILGSLPCVVPLLWVVIVLNARGVARLILKPWRNNKTYGFRVIGVTTLLVVLFDLALEPFATKLARYWIWLPTKFSFTWHGMPWSNSLGCGLTTLLILAFATPLLINKQSRSRKQPPDFHPLIVWVLLLILLGTAAALAQFWIATGWGLILAGISVGFAVRGARW